MHVLGQEAVESKEEDPAAAGYVGWRSDWHQFHCHCCYSCHHHWPSCLGRQKGTYFFSLFELLHHGDVINELDGMLFAHAVVCDLLET